MGTFSIWHWLVVLLVVVLLFGTKKLRNVGSDLGAAVKSFRKGMAEADAEEPGKIEQAGTDAVGDKADEGERAKRG